MTDLSNVPVLVFGRGGQLSTELARRLPGATYLGEDDGNLSDPEGCAAKIRASDAALVINAAAWTAVDAAEEQEAEALVINGTAPGAMARAAAETGVPFLHVSTDYVFDGSGERPWRPDDTPNPLSAYGRTKLAGEEAVKGAGGRYAILRTAWVVSAHGSNFIKTMLRLGAERDALRVVDDQIGGPTPAAGLAEGLIAAGAAMLEGQGGGLHHLSGAPEVSWAEVAETIMARAGLSCTIERIPSSEYPLPAPRPMNSRLDCASYEAAFGQKRPDWQAGLDEILKELGYG